MTSPILIESRPSIRRDILLIPVENGLLIDGTPRQEVIRGAIAQTILPSILELLDGTRTLAEVVDALPGVPRDLVENAISSLEQWDLIDHRAEREGRELNHETLAFLKRSAYGFNLTPNIESRLEQSAVVIIAEERTAPAAYLLREMLKTSGIPSVRSISVDAWNPDGSDGRELVVFLDTPCPERLWAHVRWMSITLDSGAGRINIGPIFDPARAGCFACFNEVYKVVQTQAGDERLSGYGQHIWLSLVAMEITQVAVIPELSIANRSFRRVRSSDWASEILTYPLLPGCGCGKKERFAPDGSEDTAYRLTDTALVFEDQVGMEEKGLSPSHRDEASVPQNRPGSESKRFPNSLRVPLPSASLALNRSVSQLASCDPVLRTAQITLTELASVLAITGGSREISARATKRWAPTGGNLGSVELFVLVRNVDGLEPGVYFYQTEDHSLAKLRRRICLPVDEIMIRVRGRSVTTMPDVLLVFTGAFHRLAGKYGAFGYRLLNLDAGAAMSQMHLAAASMSISSHTLTEWADDVLEEQLNLIPPREQVTGAVELSRAPSFPRLFSRWRRPMKQGRERPPSWKPGSEFRDVTIQQLADHVYQDSRLPQTQIGFAPFEVPGELRPVSESSKAAVSLRNLRDTKLTERSFGDVITKRRSVRSFTSGSPVPGGVLLSALKVAHEADEREWSVELSKGVTLTSQVFVRAATGVESGVYRYSPEKQGMVFLRRQLSPHENVALTVQDEFSDASVLIWITGNLAAACARYGAFGHRQLLLRAGAVGHRLWLTAMGFGVDGCLCGGVVPGAARVFGIDGYTNASLFACVLGYEARAAEGA